NANGVLTRGNRVTYALRRVATARGLEVPGGLAVEYHQIPLDENATPGEDPANGNCSVKILPYELPNANGVITYQLFRSKPSSTQLLYLAATLTQTQVNSLTSNLYTDTTADDDLDQSVTINLDSDGMELTIPPCRYVRAWRGALVCGGARKRTVRFAGAAASAALTVTEGDITADDLGAYVTIEGESLTHWIVGVSGASVTLDSALDASYADATMAVWRENDVVYVSRPLPGNIEVYSAENGRLITNSGSDNEITGIAANGSYAYIFRKDKVEILTGTPATPNLEPFPASPPGCRSHATIADTYSPFVIYYAGRNGVWLISGSEAKRLSASIDPLIVNGVDHSQDEFAHAVYDPGNGVYYLFLFSSEWRQNGIRMPDMVLMYDTLTGSWTRGEMYASRSGLWRDSSGELIPVIGLPFGVARINVGDTDGGVCVSGTVSGFGVDSFMMEGSPDLSEVVPGMPVFFGDGRAAVRRMVADVTDGVVAIYGEVPDMEIGCPVSIGAIRWHFVTPEVGLSSAFDRTLKLETLAIAHGKTEDAMPVEVVMQGVGNLADDDDDRQEWNGRVDFSERSVSRLDGKATGLRAASVQMAVYGGHAPVVVKGVRIDMEKVSR
ncbi:MAG: hypothetical protein IJS15_17155, partial [Victivallales bacterium]|nr:hypothetical protein [Victivallales bacterium]